MGSVETPSNNNIVANTQNKVSDNNVMKQVHPKLEGPNKRKRECNLPSEKHLSKHKRKAHNDDEEIYSDNNTETDTSSVTSEDEIVYHNNENKHEHSVSKIKQPPIVVTL